MPLPPASPAPATHRGGPPHGPPYWAIVLGGLVLAVGTTVTGQTHFDVLMLTSGPGPFPESFGFVQLEGYLTALGSLLTAAGFVSIFAGIAFALRRPSMEPRRGSSRAVAVSVIGGSLVAAGLVAASVVAFYSYPPFPLGFQGYYTLDLAGRVAEALGFLVGFVGIAEVLHP